MYAVVTIAAADHVSLEEVVARGFTDLAYRVAKMNMDKQRKEE